MKIKSELLASFITKATLNGSIGSMVIKITDEGLSAQQKELSNAGMTQAKLSLEKIKEKENMELCIKNTPMLIKSLASFSGDIEIKKNTNILSLLNAERQIDIVLSSEEFIDCNLSGLPENLKNAFDKGFNISSEPLKKIVSDMGIVESTSIVIEIKDKRLILSTGEKGFDTISVKAVADYTDCSANYSELLAKAINVIDGKINIALKKDFPIQLIEEADGIYCKYIVAPLVSKE